MNQMKQLVCAMLVLGAFSNVAGAVDWKNGVYNDVAVTSTVTTVGGYFYRVKLDGRILRRESGSRTYRNIRLQEIPAIARGAVARRYDAFVPPIERDYSTTVTRGYYGTTTDDHSNRSRTRDDHSSRTRTRTRDDHSDRSQEYRFEEYRDRDVEYRAHTRGSLAPVIIAHDNRRSTVSVHVHPVDATMAMHIAAQNSQLTQQVIAANRGQSQAEALLRIEQCKPPRVEIRTVRVRDCQPRRSCHTTPCPEVRLRACWVGHCGKHFRDQYGRNWYHHSGVVINNRACEVKGCLGQLPDGRLTITIRWSGGTSVYVDP